MTAPTPAEIAKRLTKAQRDGVISGFYDDDSSLRGGQRKMFYRLTELQLFGKNRHGKGPDFSLTPLGLAVRAALSEMEGRDG